jgi:hypothetical protein
MSRSNAPARAPETTAYALAERAFPAPAFDPSGRRPRSIGRVRLPIAGPYRPWAVLYELPDGRRLWSVRLWDLDRPVTRCLSTGTLLAFARLNRLDSVRSEIEAIAARE